MSRGYAFRAEARQELRDAVRYYEKAARGLGAEFSAEVRATIERLLLYPDSGPAFETGTRRKHLVRFPYSIAYVQHQGRVEIVALMHSRRDPHYWAGRIQAPARTERSRSKRGSSGTIERQPLARCARRPRAWGGRAFPCRRTVSHPAPPCASQPHCWPVF